MENGGNNQANTDKIQRLNESIPGNLNATEIEIAITRLDNGIATNGLNIINGILVNPKISNNNPAVTIKPQNTAITITD